MKYRGTPALVLRELRAGVREELLRFVREAVARLLRQEELQRLGISEVFSGDLARELIAREDEHRVAVVGQTMQASVLSCIGQIALDACGDRTREVVVAQVYRDEQALLCATEVRGDRA